MSEACIPYDQILFDCKTGLYLPFSYVAMLNKYNLKRRMYPGDSYDEERKKLMSKVEEYALPIVPVSVSLSAEGTGTQTVNLANFSDFDERISALSKESFDGAVNFNNFINSLNQEGYHVNTLNGNSYETLVDHIYWMNYAYPNNVMNIRADLGRIIKLDDKPKQAVKKK